MRYFGIEHEEMEKYGESLPKDIIFAYTYKIVEHQFGITRCNK